MSILEDISARIAKFAHEQEFREGSWAELSPEDQKIRTEVAWRAVFKQEREFSDPYFQLRDANDTPLLARPYDRMHDYEDARQRARNIVGDDDEIVRVVEIVEREATAFYQRVVKTVVERDDPVAED